MITRFAAFLVASIRIFSAHNSEGRRKMSETLVGGDGASSDVDEGSEWVGMCFTRQAEEELRYSLKGSKDYRVAVEDGGSGFHRTTPGASDDDVESGSRKLLVFSQCVPRRYLRRHTSRKHRVLITASALAPAPSPSPFSTPSDEDIAMPLQPTKNSKPLPLETEDDNQMSALLACSVLGVVLVSLLLFVCLRKKGTVNPKDEQRDAKPLINLVTGGISEGTTAEAMSNPSGKDFKAHSFTGHLAPDPDPNWSYLSESGPNEAGTERKSVSQLLPLPPGRMPVAPPKPPEPPPPSPPKTPSPTAPPPPPPPKSGCLPPNPPPPGPMKPIPPGPHRLRISAGGMSNASGEKTKLKPFFWDKVLASPNQSMVWHEIKTGSFQFNEEMMETLFGYTAPADKNKNDHKDSSPYDSPQFIQIIEPKKAQNLSILLKALSVTTEEVCYALKEGNELPSELTQTLLKMAPTSDEELKLHLYAGDISLLGPAERFLKVIVDIPFAFKRLESLLFVSTFQEEYPSTKESLATLEVACKELKNSRLFLKLLEAVLKTGNRMNDGTYRGGAQAFKLDTLLKLADVKGTDGKTTLLHFVVLEIIRSEGIRTARRLGESRSMSSVKTEDIDEEYSNELEEYHRSLGLEVVSSISMELQNVKKAAIIDNDSLSENVHKLGQGLNKTKEFLDVEMKDMVEESEFCDALTIFVEECESDIKWLKEESKRITTLVKSTGDYFHGRAGREEGAHLFVIVRDFLSMVEKACLDVKNSSRLSSKMAKKEAWQASPSATSPAMKGSFSESTDDYFQRLGSHN